MKRDLSPEARGVLAALTSLGKIRHLDRVSLEFAEAGLAEVRAGQLEIDPRGRKIVRRPKRLAEAWDCPARASARLTDTPPAVARGARSTRRFVTVA